MEFRQTDRKSLDDVEYNSLAFDMKERRKKCRRIGIRVACGTVQVFTVVFLVVFVVFPLIFKFSYRLQRSSVFLVSSSIDPDSEFARPSKYGLAPARNFYLPTTDGASLGVWHILPENLTSDADDSERQEPYPNSVINNGQDFVIYCHGNAGNRANDYRVELYKVLRRYFHVIAFDYRGYGDSSNDDLTEQKVIEDAVSVYTWTSNKTKANVFIWGHSLGTSIAIQAAIVIQERGLNIPSGIILEAPFNNMKDEISEFPLARPFSFLPWFTFTVTEPMLDNGFRFESDQVICNVNAPIIILHSEDDSVVPYKLGKRLYAAAQNCRKPSQGSVSFRTFDGRFQYNHRYICRAPELPEVIGKFVEQASKEAQEIRHST